MVEDGGAADLVDVREPVFHSVGDVVEEPALVDRTSRPPFGAGPVVGDQHDQRVVILAEILQELDELTNVVVGVLKEAGEDLHHSGKQAPLVG